MERMIKIMIVLFVVAGGIFAAVLFFNREHSVSLDEMIGKSLHPQSSEQEKQATIDVIKKQKPSVLDTEDHPTFTIKKPKLNSEKDYKELREDVKSLCSYLDQREYIQKYNIKEGTYQHFLALAAELSENRPLIYGETKDIYSLMKNMSHLWRVIKKENIDLIKDILTNEKELTESSMDLIYEWIHKELMMAKTGEIKISPESLYEYSAFFLHTIAGKAYLGRRDSKTRILITYYSVRVLDNANRQCLNHYGVDIVPFLAMLGDDINNYVGLEYRDLYLEKLDVMRHVLKSRT